MILTGRDGQLSCACAPNPRTSTATASRIRFMEPSYLHVHAIRGAAGAEILIARVLAADGRIGLGFSFRLDATEARHMAEWAAGVRSERPRYQPVLDHPWEKAWLSQKPIEWKLEPAFERISWRSGA
jgi:hypothetical protein